MGGRAGQGRAGQGRAGQGRAGSGGGRGGHGWGCFVAGQEKYKSCERQRCVLECSGGGGLEVRRSACVEEDVGGDLSRWVPWIQCVLHVCVRVCACACACACVHVHVHSRVCVFACSRVRASVSTGCLRDGERPLPSPAM